jgi:hypothetical protein
MGISADPIYSLSNSYYFIEYFFFKSRIMHQNFVVRVEMATCLPAR